MEKERDFFKEDGKQIGYSKVGNDFFRHQVDLSGRAVKIYGYLIWEANRIKKLNIKKSNKEISYNTGIKDSETVGAGIRDLVKRGWIRSIEVEPDGAYVYRLAIKKEKPNLKLLQWLEERSEKQKEKNNLRVQSGNLVRDKKGLFQKSISEEDTNEN